MVASPGAIVFGAEISGMAKGSAFKVVISDEGVARIPKCAQFEIAFAGYRGLHKVLNPEANEFLVTLDNTQLANWAIDEIWLVEGDRLYVASADGSFNRRYWLGKLSRAKERTMFREVERGRN